MAVGRPESYGPISDHHNRLCTPYPPYPRQSLRPGCTVHTADIGGQIPSDPAPRIARRQTPSHLDATT